MVTSNPLDMDIPRLRRSTHGALALDIISIFFVWLFIGVRLIHQRRSTRKLDRLAITSNVFICVAATVLFIWVIIANKDRTNYLNYVIDPEGKMAPTLTSKAHFMFFIFAYLYTLALWMIKCCFLMIYIQIVPVLKTRIRLFLNFVIVVVVCNFIATIFVHSFWCRPISGNWRAGPVNCTTWRSVPALAIMSTLNITSDLLILLLPTLIIREFRLRRSESWALLFVFIVGISSIVAAFLRMVFIYKAYHGPQDDNGAVYKIEKIKTWSTVEVSTAAIAFCLPSLRGILRALMTKKKNRERNTGGSGETVVTIGSGGKKKEATASETELGLVGVKSTDTGVESTRVGITEEHIGDIERART